MVRQFDRHSLATARTDKISEHISCIWVFPARSAVQNKDRSSYVTRVQNRTNIRMAIYLGKKTLKQIDTHFKFTVTHFP